MTEPPDNLAARLADLELRYTHLQRTVEDLDSVIVSQARQIEALERKLGLVTSQVRSLADREPETRTLEDDKPPHY